MLKPIIIAIVGPTSSGKTLVSIEISKRLNVEIISFDSMQIYKGMDEITSVPSDEILKGCPHHLVKILSPEEEYNAMRFASESGKIIEKILDKGKIPLLAGGTGLYLKALISGIFPSPGRDKGLRKMLEKKAADEGNESLFKELESVDPETAVSLHPNDIRRVIRALEVYNLTGKKMSEGKSETTGLGEKYDFRIFGLRVPRKVLYARINKCVENIVEGGAVDAVKKLRKRHLSMTAGKALGIKEICAYLDGKIGRDEAIEELKKNTRRYAKRQMTWFRADENIEWIDAERDAGDIAGEIVDRVQGQGAS